MWRGVISTIAGNYTQGYTGDNGQAECRAELMGPTGVALDTAGNLYIADFINNAVRELQAGGTTTVVPPINTTTSLTVSSATVADGQPVDVVANVIPAPNEGWIMFRDGNAYLGETAVVNGTATLDNISLPVGTNVLTATYVDPQGHFAGSVADAGPESRITTLAGSGEYGFSGDGGSPNGATLNQPTGVAVDSAGDIFIADTSNNVIREVNRATGIINTIAGTWHGWVWG